ISDEGKTFVPHLGHTGGGRRGHHRLRGAGHAGAVGVHFGPAGQPYAPGDCYSQSRRRGGDGQRLTGGPPLSLGLLHGGQSALPPGGGGGHAAQSAAVILAVHAHSSFSASFSLALARLSRESTVFRGQPSSWAISAAV